LTALILTHCAPEEDLEQIKMFSEPKDDDKESVVKKSQLTISMLKKKALKWQTI